MLDTIILKCERTLRVARSREDYLTIEFCLGVINDLEELKQFQEKEKQQLFTPEQEKEIRKYIKEQLEEVKDTGFKVTNSEGNYVVFNNDLNLRQEFVKGEGRIHPYKWEGNQNDYIDFELPLSDQKYDVKEIHHEIGNISLNIQVREN